jgi:serine/threonine-protein kinase
MIRARMKPGALLAGKYRLEHVLGSGGMGEVWAATNESTGRSFAIKMLHGSTPDLRTRMLREARAGGTLRHKNIVEIYDVGETDDGDPFLVMERLSGETLGERLEREGSLPPAAAVEIAGAIAAALRVAHAKGIVHRDLKPANVFLHREADTAAAPGAEGEGEVVKVLDFGVSKHLQDKAGTITSGLVGSPPYMSPEQACAEPNVDARSDLWSLGVVLFQMLAGRRPFPTTSPYMVITEIVNGPIPSIAEAVPGLSPGVVRVVQRSLTRDVDAREGSADELIRLLGSSLVVDLSIEDAPTDKAEAALLSSTEQTTKAPEGSAHLPAQPPSGTTAPLVLVGEAPATMAMGDGSGPRPIPTRGPSNTVVALVAGAAALLLIVVFGVALRRAPPIEAAATSAAAASTALPEATNPMGEAPKPPPQAPPEPVVAKAPPPEAPASSEPAPLPRLGKNEALIVLDAPATTSVSLDGKQIGTTPVAPVVVPPGSHRVLFKHPTLGERVVVVTVQAGEATLAATEFGSPGSAHPQTPRTHPSGERRFVWP